MVRSNKSQTFSTGRIAKLCGVSIATVQKWIDAGEIPSYWLPVTNSERRVTREDLLTFMRRYGIPTGELDESARTYCVLVAGVEGKAEALVKRAFENAKKDVEVRVCNEAAELLLLIGELIPDAIVFDYHWQDLDAARMIEFLRQDERFRNTRHIVVSDLSDGERADLGKFDIKSVLPREYQPKKFTEIVTEMVRDQGTQGKPGRKGAGRKKA